MLRRASFSCPGGTSLVHQSSQGLLVDPAGYGIGIDEVGDVLDSQLSVFCEPHLLDEDPCVGAIMLADCMGTSTDDATLVI